MATNTESADNLTFAARPGVPKLLTSTALRDSRIESVCMLSRRYVTFIFVPGHAGVRDNERAECLASKSTLVDEKTMDRVDSLSVIRETS